MTELLQAEVSRLNRLLDLASKDIAQLQAEIAVWSSDLHDAETERDNLKELLEPGKCAAIMDALWREAERLGHRSTSSRHALSYLVEQVELSRRVITAAKRYDTCNEVQAEMNAHTPGSAKCLHVRWNGGLQQESCVKMLIDSLREYEAAQ
jgi:predicted  nucleic acid-binding Zn-ribbon protein